jgi:hypothetical protein
VLHRKDCEISKMNAKQESDQTLIAQLQKKIKELQVGLYAVLIHLREWK